MLNDCGRGRGRLPRGMADELRARAQEDFVADRAPVIVATNAFGMGIDKSNVSFVVHYNMPKDLRAIIRRRGARGRRRGRGLLPAVSAGDVRLNTF